MGRTQFVRQVARFAIGSVGSLGLALAGPVSSVPAVMATVHPTVAEYAQISSSTTPPTEAQCVSVGRRCFTPQGIQASYNLGPLYAAGLDGRGMTIAIVDSVATGLCALRPRRLPSAVAPFHDTRPPGRPRSAGDHLGWLRARVAVGLSRKSWKASPDWF